MRKKIIYKLMLAAPFLLNGLITEAKTLPTPNLAPFDGSVSTGKSAFFLNQGNTAELAITNYEMAPIAYDISGSTTVEVVRFTAAVVKQQVRLKWLTAFEKDNHSFYIERSKDGITFKEIGKVKGIGNSTMEKAYSLVDESPINGLNYYRLKQVGLDGTYTYSDVVTIKFNSIIDFDAYPNPFIDELSIKAKDKKSSIVSLYNISGELVYTKQIEGTTTLDLTTIPKGVYMVNLVSGDDVETKVVVKK